MTKSLQQFKGKFAHFLKNLHKLLEHDPLTEMSRAQRILARNIRVFFLVARWEALTKVKLHAQALTYTTLLSLVPLLVVVFAIFKGFGATGGIVEKITNFMISNVTGTVEQEQIFREYIQTFIGNVNAGQIGMVSIVILIWSVLMLLGHIEDSFNAIFAATSQRPFVTRILTYWAVLTFGPLLLAGSVALTAALQTGLGDYLDSLSSIGAILIWASPVIATWIAFTTMYLVVPNTRVRFSAALLSAVITGSAWNGCKFLYALYAKNSVTQQNIYGSLAIIPMFVLWLYVSWVLVLFGAQLAYAFQNAKTYRREDERTDASQNFVERVVCRLFLEVARAFYIGEHMPTLTSLSVSLSIPRKLLENLVFKLKKGGYLRITEPDESLIPGRDLQNVTVNELITYLRSSELPDPKVVGDSELHYFEGLFDEMDQQRFEMTGTLNFRELARQFISEKDGAALATVDADNTTVDADNTVVQTIPKRNRKK